MDSQNLSATVEVRSPLVIGTSPASSGRSKGPNHEQGAGWVDRGQMQHLMESIRSARRQSPMEGI